MGIVRSRLAVLRGVARCVTVSVAILVVASAAGCDSVEKACTDCCDVPLLKGVCVQACIKVAETMKLSPGDVRRECPGR